MVVLAPFLSLCQDECPLVTGAFISLRSDLRAAGLGQRVVFVEATVDPGRDSVARLAAYQREFGAHWDLWTGTAANVARFWKPFGVEYQIVPEDKPPKIDWFTGSPLTYDVDHTDGYILIGTHGRERFVDATAPNLRGLNRKLTSLLGQGAVQHLHAPPTAELDDRRSPGVHQLDAPHQRPCVGVLMQGVLRPSAGVVPAALALLALSVAACSGGGDVTTLSAPPTTDPSLTLTVQHSPVGPILATGGGNTLYDFVPDTATHSACLNDGCVFQWPPLTRSGPLRSLRVGRGVDPALVGTLRRPDGSTQLSYGGHPLYTYNLDVTPGMVTGQGIDQDGGLWYVLNAKGKQVTAAFSVNSPNVNPKM